MKTIILFIARLLLPFLLCGCAANEHANKALAVADPKAPFQCEREGRVSDCISKKELERLVEAEKYWQNNMR